MQKDEEIHLSMNKKELKEYQKVKMIKIKPHLCPEFFIIIIIIIYWITFFYRHLHKTNINLLIQLHMGT